MQMRFGKTDITTDKNAFGALPIQRLDDATAIKILRKAYDNGITFYDTARSYTDSEHKIGLALSEVRNSIYLATKSPAKTAEKFWEDLHTSLTMLKTDYVDLMQFHNPSFCPKPGGEDGLYEAMIKAKEQGKVRFIGITNHRMKVAQEAVQSGLYDTLQFPFSYLSDEVDIELVRACQASDMGFLSMKALSGGLITNSAAAYAFQSQFENVLPIWGIQKESELDEFISYMDNPPSMTPDITDIINKDKSELMGEFCRGCAYCMPCPVGIQINTCARMSLLIRRSPSASHLTETSQQMMLDVEKCINCNSCISKCPYNLDTPALIRKNLEDYKQIIATGKM